mmetsp:Transcript_45564/g.114842  ORF Transcript_45564/g.114842 Transcript_45564/m.114842 type:complete len:234 (+) Transcript_45564:85-786(+)
MAVALVFDLHGELLRRPAQRHDEHYQGLQQAARRSRRHGAISNNLAKRMGMVDTCFNLLRHISKPSCESLIKELDAHLNAFDAKLPTDDPPLVGADAAGSDATPKSLFEEIAIMKKHIETPPCNGTHEKMYSEMATDVFVELRKLLQAELPSGFIDSYNRSEDKEKFCEDIGQTLLEHTSALLERSPIASPLIDIGKLKAMLAERASAEAHKMIMALKSQGARPRMKQVRFKD